jgi:hypothetical protein
MSEIRPPRRLRWRCVAHGYTALPEACCPLAEAQEPQPFLSASMTATVTRLPSLAQPVVVRRVDGGPIRPGQTYEVEAGERLVTLRPGKPLRRAPSP